MILRCKPMLGTFVEIKIPHENSAGYCAIDEAFAAIDDVQNLMSFFDEKSQVSLLNNKAHESPITVDLQLFEVLLFAKKISQISDGIFDVTRHRSAKNISFSDIELLENCQVKFAKKLKIDLGGIAKGYAVDCAARALENHGVTNYIINAGGDLRVGETAQKIAIRNPKNLGDFICETEISQGALATSAGYFSNYKIDGEEFYPIFEPRDGALKYKDESVSVFAKDCITADALTKVALILKEESTAILEQFNAQAMLVKACGEIRFLN